MNIIYNCKRTLSFFSASRGSCDRLHRRQTGRGSPPGTAPDRWAADCRADVLIGLRQFRLAPGIDIWPWEELQRGRSCHIAMLSAKKLSFGISWTKLSANTRFEALGEPMLSTSLMLPGSEFTESDPEEIKDRLEKQVDLIIHGGYLGQKPTTVIDLTDDTPVVVREGVGDVKPFL